MRKNARAGIPAGAVPTAPAPAAVRATPLQTRIAVAAPRAFDLAGGTAVARKPFAVHGGCARAGSAPRRPRTSVHLGDQPLRGTDRLLRGITRSKAATAREVGADATARRT